MLCATAGRTGFRELSPELRKRFNTSFDATRAIGRRYRRQDEIGTPFCITYDFESEQDQKVTIRDRDSTQQERVSIDALPALLSQRIHGY